MSCKEGTHHYTESGLDNVVLERVEICQCENCDEEIVRIPAMPELNSAIGEVLIKQESILSGKEIRFLRKNMGLSATQLTKIMGVSNEAISRWENGKQKISKTHDRLIRAIYAINKGLSHEKAKSLIEVSFTEINSAKPSQPFYHQIDVNILKNQCVHTY